MFVLVVPKWLAGLYSAKKTEPAHFEAKNQTISLLQIFTTKRVQKNPYSSIAIGALMYGGERGIRTLDTLLTYTPLAGARLQPLGHFSKNLLSGKY